MIGRPASEQLRSAATCCGFVLLSMCAALAAFLWPVDAWYASIEKPSWNPPNWIFGPVWTTLYIVIGIAAWRLWKCGALARDRVLATALVAQWVLNFAWSGFFFGMRAPGAALVEIACLLALIALVIARGWRQDRVAAALLVPYLAWVGFATALNAALWRLNA